MTVTDWLIRRAKRTPYFPIHDEHGRLYMERYWLVPYRYVEPGWNGETNGTGPVSLWRRPIAWLLQRFDIAVRIHHIVRSDNDRAYHDHPWHYLTIILRGQYYEVTPDGERWWKQGQWRFARANSWHRLVVLSHYGAWTLFITFRKRQGWGFLVDGKKVPWREYLRIPPKEGAA